MTMSSYHDIQYHDIFIFTCNSSDSMTQAT